MGEVPIIRYLYPVEKNGNMRKLLILLCVLCVRPGQAAGPQYDDFFTEEGLRIDFALCGNEREQSAALQRLRWEPRWAGPRKNLIDTSGYGSYYVNLYDMASGTPIYSRGFCTLFDEWRTTDRARFETQAWDNAVVVPFPRRKVVFELTARDRATMRFVPLLTLIVDPDDPAVDRSPLPRYETVDILVSGPPSEMVDLVFLAEGYAATDRERFLADVRRFADRLFETEPYARHKDDFNIRAVVLPSADSGADESGRGIWKNTALHSGFYTFGIDRYLTTSDMRAVRDAVWNVPNDALFILVDTDIYGGGGFYNFYAIGSAGHPHTIRVFVHELGHSLAGLADEYFASEVAYNDFYDLRFEPWEPNITTLVDFGRKWADMLPSDVAVPTPVDAREPLRLGVYEGGGYSAKGIYRPADACCMRSGDRFCPVCCRAIERAIDFLCDR